MNEDYCISMPRRMKYVIQNKLVFSWTKTTSSSLPKSRHGAAGSWVWCTMTWSPSNVSHFFGGDAGSWHWQWVCTCPSNWKNGASVGQGNQNISIVVVLSIWHGEVSKIHITSALYMMSVAWLNRNQPIPWCATSPIDGHYYHTPGLGAWGTDKFKLLVVFHPFFI